MLYLLATLLMVVARPALSNEIALSFDDAPRGDERLFSGRARTQRIISVLDEFSIQTVFFANSKGLNQDGGRERLASYAKAGHLIANHTHSHPDLRQTPVRAYLRDIDEADRVLASFATFTKWFRYPFLREGDTVEIRDQVRGHLRTQGYRNGYVTVDNYDFFLNGLVQDSLRLGKRVDLKKACKMLVDLMWNGIQFYDSVAKKHIGSVRHVLLMHENDLQAQCLPDLITHLKRKQWRVIDPSRAFDEPLLAEEPSTLYLGQGRVAAIAHARTGIGYISDWENESVLRDEFKRRQIAQD
jgi:peptidoglycan/xylan/chitin deacetylase (PgdA/CDA1 family)